MAEGSRILAVNAGSSSIKFALFGPDLDRHLHGEIETVGDRMHLSAASDGGAGIADEIFPAAGRKSVHGMATALTGWLEARLDGAPLAAIGHRVAIGGLTHSAPVLVSPAVLVRLERLVPLAPLHLPRNLDLIESLSACHPRTPQVACFDTAFHRTVPELAEMYALPETVRAAGAVRYGFHGLSYEYIAGLLPGIDPVAAEGRTVVAHLGSGASMCAMKGGRSVATTMGFSPLGGLVMGTRPGELDPGLVIWLVRERGMSIDAVEHMLYHESGLKGVSGISSDMRDLLARDAPEARRAVDLFVYRAATELGALTASLGGLDALVFTAGIGEHAADVRAAICRRAAWLGISLDEPANRKTARRISAADSAVAVWVVPTNEELMVARHTRDLAMSRGQAGKEPTT